MTTGREWILADQTGSFVPPSAFTHGSACPADQCCTGVAGASVAPDGPTLQGVKECRLVFSYDAGGQSMPTSIIDGVTALLKGLRLDATASAQKDGSGAVDPVDSFILNIEPQFNGGVDSVTGLGCAAFAKSKLHDNYAGPKLAPGGDTVHDTISQVPMGETDCIRLIARVNTTVAAATVVQVFSAAVGLRGHTGSSSTISLSPSRMVYFIVPPGAYD